MFQKRQKFNIVNLNNFEVWYKLILKIKENEKRQKQRRRRKDFEILLFCHFVLKIFKKSKRGTDPFYFLLNSNLNLFNRQKKSRNFHL